MGSQWCSFTLSEQNGLVTCVVNPMVRLKNIPAGGRYRAQLLQEMSLVLKFVLMKSLIPTEEKVRGY